MFRVENVCVGLAFLPCFLVSGISAGTFGWSEMYNPLCDVKNGKIAADQVYFSGREFALSLLSLF